MLQKPVKLQQNVFYMRNMEILLKTGFLQINLYVHLPIRDY